MLIIKDMPFVESVEGQLAVIFISRLSLVGLSGCGIQLPISDPARYFPAYYCLYLFLLGFCQYGPYVARSSTPEISGIYLC